MQQDAPIGFFDSGVGGTSIWKSIQRILPHENTIYLADSKHAPYGQKPAEIIQALSVKNTEWLINKGCKLIVVACNTATTNAISELRTQYQIPFIGIEPAIKPAALKSKTQKIGILATKGTLSSALFQKSRDNLNEAITFIEVEAEGIVPLIEEGALESDTLFNLVAHYVQPLINAGIDYLVLGCSHFPYLLPILNKIVPKHISIIDSGAAVAKQTAHILTTNNLLNVSTKKPFHYFYSNTSINTLSILLKEFPHVSLRACDF